MGKLKELHNTKKIVKDILIHDEESRNSDNYLYIKVCMVINPEVEHWLFIDALKHQKELGIPPFETVRRARQKIQELHPDLAACDAVEEERLNNQLAYEAFIRGKL